MSWEDNNFNSFGFGDNNDNNNNDWENNQGNQDGGQGEDSHTLDDLLGENNQFDGRPDGDDQVTTDSSSGNGNTQGGDNPGVGESEFAVTATDVKNIDNVVQRVPNNASREPEFSERDLYRVYNIMAVFDVLGEEITDAITTSIGLQSNMKPIKKAINISQMSKQNVEKNSFATSILRDIYRVDNPGDTDNYDPISASIAAIGQLDNLNDDEKYTILDLVKKVLKSNDIDYRVRSTRNDNSPSIFSELREVLKEHPVVADTVLQLDTAISTFVDKAL